MLLLNTRSFHISSMRRTIVECSIDEEVWTCRRPDHNDDDDGAPYPTTHVIGSDVDWLMFCNRSKV